MAHPQLSSLQRLLIQKVTVLQFICCMMTTFCQFVIMVGDSGGNVSQVRTTWFLSWKLSIFFLTWAHLPTLYIALELTFLHCTSHLRSPSYIIHCIWAHLPTLYIALELTFLHCTLHLSSPSFIVYCTWAHLPTLYIAFELTFLPRALSVFLLQLYCSLRWSIVLYFAVPWCTVVHCYCPMMSCIGVLGSILFWRIALPCNTSCMVGWCITFNITFYCLLLYCIYTLYCIALYCLLMY